MVTEIDFYEIENFELLKQEINSLFYEGNYLILNKKELLNRQWIYAEMEDNEVQILEEDAKNLSNALRKKQELYCYTACAEDLKSSQNFTSLKFLTTKNDIEEFHSYAHEIPHMDSFIFSKYPLKFLIMRPVYTEKARLYYLGDKDFIKEACRGDWWTITS